MSSYNTFAYYYDRLTENVDYKVRSDYISGFFNQKGIVDGKILDLACGTGSFTKYFEDKGYDVTGVDLSDDMLTIAQSKCNHSKFIKADITNIHFNRIFDGCICCLDSINHLTDINLWSNCFKNVASSLKTGGIFVFDVNTIYKHSHILANNAFIFDEDDFFLAWDNELCEDNKVRIMLDFFVFNGQSYDRFSEEFEELALSSDAIADLLNDDFDILGVYDDLTQNTENDKSERLYFICKRK